LIQHTSAAFFDAVAQLLSCLTWMLKINLMATIEEDFFTLLSSMPLFFAGIFSSQILPGSS